jgi:hypothetical protein
LVALFRVQEHVDGEGVAQGAFFLDGDLVQRGTSLIYGGERGIIKIAWEPLLLGRAPGCSNSAGANSFNVVTILPHFH